MLVATSKKCKKWPYWIFRELRFWQPPFPSIEVKDRGSSTPAFLASGNKLGQVLGKIVVSNGSHCGIQFHWDSKFPGSL